MEDKEKNTPVKSKGTEVNKQRQLFVEWSRKKGFKSYYVSEAKNAL